VSPHVFLHLLYYEAALLVGCVVIYVEERREMNERSPGVRELVERIVVGFEYVVDLLA
jgi:hypothetical protein